MRNKTNIIVISFFLGYDTMRTQQILSGLFDLDGGMSVNERPFSYLPPLLASCFTLEHFTALKSSVVVLSRAFFGIFPLHSLVFRTRSLATVHLVARRDRRQAWRLGNAGSWRKRCQGGGQKWSEWNSVGPRASTCL